MSKCLRIFWGATSVFLITALFVSERVVALPFSHFFSALSSGTTVRASQSSEGVEGNGRSEAPDMSADGRYTVFHSEADNLVPGDYNQVADVFLYDKLLNTTEAIPMGSGSSIQPSISADGRETGSHKSDHIWRILSRPKQPEIAQWVEKMTETPNGRK
jgi:hypothetical protein